MTPRGGVDVRCIDLSQVYHVDGEDVLALQDVQLSVADGETVALFGPSGSGKSTLMSLLAGLRRPSSGQVWLGDDELTGMSERALLRVRGRQIGVVLQNPSRSLLPYGTGEDNIRFAQRATERTRRPTLTTPRDLLERLGLAELAGQRAAGLSGGEQQRLSIAVAMSGTPRLLLADEPTSQLDSANRDRVVALLHHINLEYGTTVIVITHDPVVAQATQRTVTLTEGHISDYGHQPARHAGQR